MKVRFGCNAFQPQPTVQSMIYGSTMRWAIAAVETFLCLLWSSPLSDDSNGGDCGRYQDLVAYVSHLARFVNAWGSAGRAQRPRGTFALATDKPRPCDTQNEYHHETLLLKPLPLDCAMKSRDERPPKRSFARLYSMYEARHR